MKEMLEADAMYSNVHVTMTEPLGVGNGTINTDISPEMAEQLCNEVQDYLRKVAESACGCCIDGRHDGIGPSVAGGPLITAYAAAELTGWFGHDSAATVADKLAMVKSVLEANAIGVGGHTDQGAEDVLFTDPATGKPKTGCGANDKALAIVQAVYDYPDTVAGLTQTLLGDTFDPEALKFVPKDTATHVFEEWNPKTTRDVMLEAGPDAVEVLQGSHGEALVVFNYIDGTSIDRKALVDAEGRQVFVVDMWYIDKLAQALASGPNAQSQYANLKHAMVAYQVGTYLALCDGSQRAAIVKPSEA